MKADERLFVVLWKLPAKIGEFFGDLQNVNKKIAKFNSDKSFVKLST